MKKLFLLIFILSLVGSVSATTIDSHNVTVDLDSSVVNLSLDVRDMTSSAFYYTSSFPVAGELEASADGEPLECEREPLPPGTYITCDIDDDEFVLEMSYRTEGLVTKREGVNIFRYTQGIQRPTESYRLKVLLPPGSGLAEGSNVSLPVISPPSGVSGTNGQRIYVEWESSPDLGQLSFQTIYRENSEPLEENGASGGLFWLIPAVIVSLIAAVVYFVVVSREEIESAYDELSEDEVDVLEMVRDNGSSMLQKDIVDQSDYSKAKISGVISSLEEKGIVKKSKEGRSNKISISRKYKY
jgi:uncharacterized membrane protein